MTKCDCIDPERHGHLDDCPFSEIERLRSRLADIESQNRVMWDVANDREARLAEVQDKLSIALAANHDLRDERDLLKDRLADPCRTYDKDGKLLTVCHNLAGTEARLAEAEKDVTRSRREWQRECEDTDLLLQGMGLCPSEYRSECGSLLLARIRHKMGHIGLRLDETLARLAEVEAERDKILRLWLDDADPAECGYAADSASVKCECPVEGHAPGCPNDLFTKLHATDQPSDAV